MKRIEVKNFIVLKEAIYEPKKFNVIIGPQATGKSLLVKLEYFFNKVLDEILSFNDYLFLEDDIKDIIEYSFYKYFNKEAILLYNFTIKYIDKNSLIKIKLQQNNSILKIDINQNLIGIVDKYQKEYEKQNTINSYSKFYKDFEKYKKYKIGSYGKIFIPAGRTYFSTLNESIYAILSQRVNIDPNLLDFGFYFEASKKTFEYKNIDIKNKIFKIIKGDINYSKKNKRLGVRNNDIFTNISLLSSGQQEIIPLIVVLFGVLSLNSDFIIEEPEAHLYPTSQKELIELIAYRYNQGSSISITTHSPYIITAINNLLLLDEKKDKISKDNPLFEKLDYKISSKDLGAYTIEDGVLKNIYDKENNLIDAYTIDSVSEELSREFDELLEL